MVAVLQDAKVTALRWPMAPATDAHAMPIRLLTFPHLTTSVPTAASIPHPIVHAVILLPVMLLRRPHLPLRQPQLPLHQQPQQLRIQVIYSRSTTLSDLN